MMISPKEYSKTIHEAERYLQELTQSNKSIGRPLFESKRTIFLKQGYVSALTGLIEACTIFLEKAKTNWNKKLEKYGNYLLTRLEAFTDESWRFKGDDKTVIREAYKTLKDLQKAIKETIEAKGRVNKKHIEEIQKETDKILLRLHSIEKELALYA